MDSHESPSNIVERLYCILESAFDMYVLLFPSSNVSHKPLFSRKLSYLKNYKSRLFNKFKKTGLQVEHSSYLTARSNFLTHNSECYKNYIIRCRHEFLDNPKQFIQSSFSSGPDLADLPSCVLNNCATALRKPLTKLF